MRRIYFDQLSFHDFKAYTAHVGINFLKLGTGLWFVEGVNKVSPRLGSNGAAKSTIWDALTWCLYGRTVKGGRTPDVVTWGGKRAPEVELVLSIEDGGGMREHIVSRVGKTNGLTLNDKLVTQETIDELMGLNYENFLHTIVLGQRRPLFFDLSASDKLAVLSETLNLSKWDDRIERARNTAKAISTDWGNATLGYGSATQRADDLDRDLRDRISASDEWESRKTKAAESLRKEIKQTEADLARAQDDLGKADLAYDGAELELRHSQRALHAMGESLAMLSGQALAAKAVVEQCRRISDDYKAEADAFAALKDKATCPTCGSRMDKAHHKAELKRMDDHWAGCVKAEEEAQRKADKLARDLAAMLKTSRKHEDDIALFRERSNNAIDDRTRAQARVMEYKAKLEQMRKPPADDVNPHAEQIAVLRKRLRDAVADEKRLKRESEDLDAKLQATTYWVDGFKQVRLYLIEDVLVELEAVTQTMLSDLGLEGWKIQYGIDKELKNGAVKPGLNVDLFQPGYEAPIKWESFSGGEAQRLRIIGALALSETILRRAGVQCDFLVLDEPTTHLSPEGVKETIAMLLELAKGDRTIMYCDHAAVDTRRFAGRLKVTKDERGARLAVTP
jgi:DNA repair exonuclease SbcCD ATPase subunit